MITVRSIATALVGIALFVHSSIAHSTKRNPVTYIFPVQNPVIKAPSHRIHAFSEFDLTFTLDEGHTPIRLALEPNRDILHNEFSVTYLKGDGGVREVEPVQRTTHRVYKGRAFVKRPGTDDWMQAGWARITVHRDGKDPMFEGAFSVHGDSHHIHTATHYRKLRHEQDPMVDMSGDGDDIMVVYRDSDIRPDSYGAELKRSASFASTCDSDNLGFNSRYDLEMRSLQGRSPSSIRWPTLFGRQIDNVGGDTGANYIPSIGSTDGCPGTRKVSLVGIATDCNYWEAFDQDREELRKNVIDMVNKASGLYEDTFNISLGIKNLTIIDQVCSEAESQSAPWNLACSDSTDLSDRLNLFSGWRGRSDDSNAYWTLLTTCNTKSAVGLAWRGQLCRKGSSDAKDTSGSNETIAAANVVVRTSAEWQVFAHETGHTFGAVHDCTEGVCPVNPEAQPCCPLGKSKCDAGGKFIMNPSTGQGITDFSPCSIGNICSGLKSNVDGDCLTDNKDIGTITGSQCGNGIVEEGEDCDCGGADDCGESSCCNPGTCKYRDGAECDPTNEDCCTDKCKFSPKGTVCRESNGQCDPEETCPGDSGTCPKDKSLKDGDTCGDGLHCASGQCTSRDMQCRAMLSGNGNQNNNSIKACDGDTCMMSCTADGFEGGQCAVYNSNFLDGTPCGGGGHCNNGGCQGGSTWGRIKEWFRDNKHIAIPVGCVIGGLILLAISCCIFSSCRRRMRARRSRKAPEMSGGNDSSVYGPGGNWHPNGPLPDRDQPLPEYNYATMPQGQRWQRTRSMRYA